MPRIEETNDAPPYILGLGGFQVAVGGLGPIELSSMRDSLFIAGLRESGAC
jgi:hypothetical protein